MRLEIKNLGLKAFNHNKEILIIDQASQKKAVALTVLPSLIF